jgi:uncharacterized membrane protein
MKHSPRIRFFTRAAIIASLYVAISLILHPISFGPFQVRVSETLTILPFFFPEAIWGLGIGCVLANIASPFGWIDIVFGSFCTLLAAIITWQLRKTGNPYLGMLPPVIINALGVGLYISILIQEPPAFHWLSYLGVALSVAVGQIIAVGAGGSMLIHFLRKYKEKFL